jgi:hypothetical protein
MRTYAAVVHGLLRNELQLWTSVFEMRSTASMRAYVAICCAIVREMQATLFPTASESTKEGAKALKAKPLNDFGSSQINKQVNFMKRSFIFSLIFFYRFCVLFSIDLFTLPFTRLFILVLRLLFFFFLFVSLSSSPHLLSLLLILSFKLSPLLFIQF